MSTSTLVPRPAPAIVAFSAQDPSTLVWLDVERSVIVKHGLDGDAVRQLHREVELLQAGGQLRGLSVPDGRVTPSGAEFEHVRGVTLGRWLWGARRRQRRLVWEQALVVADQLDQGAAGPTHLDFTVENLLVGRGRTLTLIDWKEEQSASADSPVALASLIASAVVYRSTDLEGRWEQLRALSPALARHCSPGLAAAVRDREVVSLRGVSGGVRERLAGLIEAEFSPSGP